MPRARACLSIAVVLVALWAPAALGRAWRNIEPGVSHREEVVKLFGEPSRTVTEEGR